jgi:hypothetical protein
MNCMAQGVGIYKWPAVNSYNRLETWLAIIFVELLRLVLRPLRTLPE